MYGNGATTATDGVTMGEQGDGEGNAFVARRSSSSKEKDHMSMPDLLLHSQEQSDKRMASEGKRLLDDRAWMEKCRREREDRDEKREEQREKFTLQLLSSTVTQLATIFNAAKHTNSAGGPHGAPPVEAVAVLNKSDKPSLSVESPDVSAVSSKSSLATPGKYREPLDVFMEQNCQVNPT